MSGLYEAALLDHAKHPRNFGPLPGADRVAEGSNPLCGDELTLRLRVCGGRIEEIAFEGQGCAVCLGSTSMMTVAARGLSEAEALELMRRVHALVRGGGDPANLGDLAALGGVARFPARAACALLGWRALASALGVESAQL